MSRKPHIKFVVTGWMSGVRESIQSVLTAVGGVWSAANPVVVVVNMNKGNFGEAKKAAEDAIPVIAITTVVDHYSLAQSFQQIGAMVVCSSPADFERDLTRVLLRVLN